ncbi:MAG: hypothetical protein Q7U10_03675 [Thermodesulfovibrionia bacterium]|nr:hypothetical protein [Thermodesulfovibrionia bacterium]
MSQYMVKGEIVMTPINQNESSIPVKKGRVDSISIFEVTESELETLESATPTGILFDIGVSCLSVAIAFTISLATTEIENDRAFYSFLIVVVVGYLAFIAFTIIWLVTRQSVKKLTKKIRERMSPPKNTQQEEDSTE